MPDLKTVSQSLQTLKTSVDALLKQRLDKFEAAFHRHLTELGNRLSQLESDKKADHHRLSQLEHTCTQHMEAFEVRLERRLLDLERTVDVAKKPPLPPKVNRRIERNPDGAITRIIEE